MKVLRLLLAILSLVPAAAGAAPCDLGFADQAAFSADWSVGANLAWAKPDEDGQRLFVAQCRDCPPALSLAVRVIDLSLGADRLSQIMQARPLDQTLDDLKLRRELLEAYRRDQWSMLGASCSGVSFSGRRDLGGLRFAVFHVEGNCELTGAFGAFEYIAYRNGCGYRLRFTWSDGMALQNEPFEKVRRLLPQIKLSP
jgi:hypothetical protein